ncbi:MAG: hypothetical protein AABY13_00215 [Nanoarchaeota archaeon]
MSVQRLYLRGLGIFFILVVITFVLEILKFGWRRKKSGSSERNWN